MTTYTIYNEFLTVKVESLGAQLKSIKTKDGTEYLWQGDDRYWSDRALNIFPYVARLYGGKYKLYGKEYNMNIHGFAWTSEFSLVKQDEASLTLSLCENEETLKQYPYKFNFSVTYILKGNKLLTIYYIENKNDKTMYFGLGGHPGFNIPLGNDGVFEDYRLRFDESCAPVRIGFTPDCFLNGEDNEYPLTDNVINLKHELFDDDAIVLKNIPKKVTLESVSGSRAVTVEYPGMDYLGIWHAPKTDAPYVCIEPWCSLPSFTGKTAVFENQKDLLSLNAYESYENSWSITVK